MQDTLKKTVLLMAFLLQGTVVFSAQGQQVNILGGGTMPNFNLSDCINCQNWRVFYEQQRSCVRDVVANLVNTRAELAIEKAIVADLRRQPDIQQMRQQAAQVAAGELAAMRAQIGNLTATSVGLFRRVQAEQAIVASERATVDNLRAQLDAATAENARMKGCIAQQHTEIEVLRQQCALWSDQNALARAEIMCLQARLLAIEAKGFRRQ